MFTIPASACMFNLLETLKSLVTARVPATAVLPLSAATVNLFVFTLKLPDVSRVPAADTLPEGFTTNLSVKILKFPERSKSPATPKFPAIFILEQVKLPTTFALPPIFMLPEISVLPLISTLFIK